MAIDFDRLFAQSLGEYENEIKRMNEQQVEDFAERLYEKWLETPNSELMWCTPAEYFRQYNPQNLCEAALEYAREGKRLPDPLSHEILARAVETERILIDIIGGNIKPFHAKGAIAAIGLLTEMQSSAAVPTLVKLACDHKLDAQLADSAAEAAVNIGGNGARMALDMLPLAETDEVEDRLVDIICSARDYRLAELAFPKVLDIFHRRRDQRAFYASCLAKLGDDRAVEPLMAAIADPTAGYYEYTAVRYALEALGEIVDIERDFSGDDDYEYMKEQGE